MAGYHHLFIPGPTNMPERIRRAMDRSLENMRAPDFPAFSQPLLEDLKKVFQTRSGRAFVFPGSGTGGWEAAVTNTLSPGDKVLATRHGQFSQLWIKLCEKHGLNVEVIDRPWGEGVPVEQFAEILTNDTAHEIKAVLACHNETATGVTSDVAGVRRALDSADHPALLFVDGVSSIGSLEFRMDEWGVDAAVTGSQKGFMLPTGLAIVAFSQKALAASENAKLGRFYFDLAEMGSAHETGYFPYTPAATLMHGLRESIDMLLEEGLENVYARHAYLAEGVRQAVRAWDLPFCATKPEWYSDTVTTIRLPEGADGAALVRHAYERYDLSLGGGLSQVAGKVVRIGHMGYVNELMLMSALSGLEMSLRDFGVAVEPGTGVAAAQEFYRAAGAATTRVAAE